MAVRVLLSAYPLTTATGIELTTGWNVNAAYEHFWSPRWRTSLYGGYAEVSYGSAANDMLCGQLGFGSTAVGAGCWYGGGRCGRLQRQLEHLVDRFAHPVEYHQGLLHGRGRDIPKTGRDDDADGLPLSPVCSPTTTLSCSNTGALRCLIGRRGQRGRSLPRPPRLLSVIA